jgi:hypothetical protein
VEAIELEAIEHEPVGTLVARGAAYAREYAAIEHKPELLAKNLAVVLLALRKQHDDWLGRYKPYRQDAGEVYRLANLSDKEQLERLQSTVRYHLGNMLRRYLTPRELRALGLHDSSPLERQQDTRATNAALVKALKVSTQVAESTPKTPTPKKSPPAEEPAPALPTGAGLAVRATADHLRLAHAAANIVAQFSTDVIDEHMTDGQRAKLDEELAAMEKRIRSLRRHLKTRRSEG